MPAFTQNGEIGKIYANQQDGNGEQEVAKVFVNKQDGNGEQLVWRNTILIEDFEDTNPLSEWNIPSQTGTVDTDTNTVYNGGVSMNTQADGLTDAFAATADLGASPQPGDKWEVYVYLNTFNSSAQARFYFGRQGAENTDCYAIHLYKDGTFRLEVDQSGTNTQIAGTTVSPSTGVWYRIRHWWEHPDFTSDHVLELTDMSTNSQLAQVSGNDTTWNQGNIGLRMNSAAGGFWDWMRITDRTV